MAWVEAYLVRRKLGEIGIQRLSAREVEAFLILEHELEAGTERSAGSPSRLQTSVTRGKSA
jgi:hypothetical protein